jgi:hypothetical protein
VTPTYAPVGRELQLHDLHFVPGKYAEAALRLIAPKLFVLVLSASTVVAWTLSVREMRAGSTSAPPSRVVGYRSRWSLIWRCRSRRWLRATEYVRRRH